MTTKLVTPPLEIRRAGEQGLVSGYGAVFSNIDLMGDVIEPGAFAASLAEHRRAGTMPAMLWSHDPSRPVGRWTSAVEDDRGLRVEGQLTLSSAAGREAFELLRGGASTGMSIGFAVPTGGRSHNSDGTATLTKIDLWEISLVTMPANPQARVISVKLYTARDCERFLRSAGLSRQAALKITAGGWPLLSGHGQAELSTIVDDLAATLKSAHDQPQHHHHATDYDTAADQVSAAYQAALRAITTED